MTELIVRGGTVYDPDDGTLRDRDIYISRGVFVLAEPEGAVEVDATGLIVAPALVDLHTHVFSGQDLGMVPDDIAPPSGTGTLIDAGSAGAHLFGAFRRSLADQATTDVRAFLNVATIGTTSIMLGGELQSPWYTNAAAAKECIEANRDLIIGVKVRASADVGGAFATPALHVAREVADDVGLPLMVHLGPAPATIDEITSVLGAGDILTHAFSGWPGNSVIEDGRVRKSVTDAQARGVILDVGHGMGGFSIDTARRMIAYGALPDTISTDLHAYSQDLVVDFPTVLSKFLALGLSIEEVLLRATKAPAEAARLDAGSLRPGARGDLALLRLVHEPTAYHDRHGASAAGTSRFECKMTVAAGRPVFVADRTVSERKGGAPALSEFMRHDTKRRRRETG